MRLLIIISLLFISACQSIPDKNHVYASSKGVSLKNESFYKTIENSPVTLHSLLYKLKVKLTEREFDYLDKLVTYEQNKLIKNQFVQRAFKRGNRYIPYIQSKLKSSGLPTEFVYLAMIESGFKTSAKSHKGATGVWQLMPRTSIELGLPSNQRHDVVKSTKAAIKYLNSRYAVFGNKALLVAASYNIGEGGVSSRLRRLDNPFNRSFIAIHHKLPKETKDYVPRWLAATLIGNQLTNSPYFKTPKAILIAEKPYKISSLLKSTGIDKSEFYKNNPAFKNKRFLSKTNNFIVLNNVSPTHNIQGLLLTVNSNYSIVRLNESKNSLVEYKKKRKYRKPKFKQHYTKIKIYRGVTFSHLKQWFGIRRNQLVKYNGNLKYGLQSGTHINIPANIVRVKSYKVRRGDTLGKIAQRYKISLKQLKLTNGLNKSRIYVGQKISIFNRLV